MIPDEFEEAQMKDIVLNSLLIHSALSGRNMGERIIALAYTLGSYCGQQLDAANDEKIISDIGAVLRQRMRNVRKGDDELRLKLLRSIQPGGFSQ